ncbi:MAG: biotin--[acetyl-CoA-carboxylase] ligase [Candidatus Sumerlaeaceae bacterium]|nr:biotin--[acetyl-CoA-carboxylase] ligase [Candidatus Sumerlaeaceae bacterium]
MSWDLEGELGCFPGEPNDDAVALAEALRELNLVRQVHYFRNIDSTSRWLSSLVSSAKSSATLDGILAVADYQTAGKGRFNRSWLAPPGKALLFSISLKAPPRLVVTDELQISHFVSMAGPVSVAEGIRQHAGVPATIKFPNDIILGQSKCAGLLVERCTNRPDVYLLGIGVNVNQTREELPRTAHLPATSLLNETGHKWDRWELLGDILERLEAWWKDADLDKLSGKMDELCMTVGRRIQVTLECGLIEGTALGISRAGGLLVRTDFGVVKEVFSGDVRELSAEI